MKLDAVKDFAHQLSHELLCEPYTLASRRLACKIEKKEWSYVSNTSHPVLNRLAASAFVLTDKVVHILSQLAMTVESAAKTVWIAYLTVSYIEGRDFIRDALTIHPVIEMGYRSPLSAIVCAAYVVALPLTIPYGLVQAWYDPAAYAEKQLNPPV